MEQPVYLLLEDPEMPTSVGISPAEGVFTIPNYPVRSQVPGLKNYNILPFFNLQNMYRDIVCVWVLG